jgi:hypothetical protein
LCRRAGAFHRRGVSCWRHGMPPLGRRRGWGALASPGLSRLGCFRFHPPFASPDDSCARPQQPRPAAHRRGRRSGVCVHRPVGGMSRSDRVRPHGGMAARALSGDHAALAFRPAAPC